MRKKKSSFDNITKGFDLDGHDTIVYETDLKDIDKNQKKKSNWGY